MKNFNVTEIFLKILYSSFVGFATEALQSRHDKSDRYPNGLTGQLVSYL
jgi:hypothetical protein